MSVFDKIMLRKRALVESVNDELKNIARILLFPEETIYLDGVRVGQSIDVVLIPYIELTLNNVNSEFQAGIPACIMCV